MKWLIIGANGLIGREVGKQLDGKYEWVGTYFKREEPGLSKVDITSDDDLNKIFKEVEPSYVINCANLAGGVNHCEKNPDLAEKFHLNASVSIGQLCKQYDSKFLFISTDYVFDGTKGPYKEEDEPNPLNVYGRLKLEAERWICDNLQKYVIIRTTNVFGWDPETVTPNYMMGLYRSIKEKKEVNAPTFLWGNPTYAKDLALAIIELCTTGTTGVFHVVGKSFINRYDWAKKVCEATGWDTSLVNPVREVPSDMIPRPLKSNLNTTKFENICKTRIRDVDQGINAFIQDMKESE